MPKPILIIDDEEKFAQMLQELLHLNGYEADYRLNPEEALVSLRQTDFELVITDYKMPGMDGAQFLQEIRKMNPDLPVIMISGLMNMPELIKVANLGVTLVLEKPFKTETLIEYVSRFVGPTAGGEVSAQAVDAEASELNFQGQESLVSYPSPSRFFSNASTENKRFLESMWNNANTSRHLLFSAQRGAEVRLLAKEIMDWTDQDSEADVVRIELLDTKTDITRSWILESDSIPGVLVVDARDTAWDEGTVRILSEWIDFVECCGRDLSMARFLYALPTGAGLSSDQLDLPDEVIALVSPDCPFMVPLRDRLLDTVTYINRLLSSEEKAALGETNLIRLLHYAWPGGYNELQTLVGKLKSRLESNEGMSSKALEEIFINCSDNAAPPLGELDLEGYLKRRQREYLQMHRKAEESIKDTLLRLGIEEKEIDPAAIVQGEVLVYPELMETE